MRARPSRSPIFLGLPLLRVAFSTCERWSLVLSHIRATDDFEISRFRAISPSDSPVFSVRNQTLARCLAEIFPVYTITNCETVCSCNRVTVNPLYSLKYCKRDYATKQVLRYDEFKIVAFRLDEKSVIKHRTSSKPAPRMITHLKTPKNTYFPCSNTVKTAFLVGQQIQTIMDKSLGTVVQFERFLTHAKLYPRATSTVRLYPLPHPTDSVETVKGQFL